MKYLLLVLLSISLIACKKSDDQGHPFITGDYFHCKVDGVDWYASTDNDLFTQAVTGELKGDTSLQLAAYSGIQSIAISIYASSIATNQSYTLSDYVPYHPCAIYDDDLSTGYFTTDSLNKGQIVITLLDRKNSVVEGNFFFKVYHPVKKKTVNITEGSFSIKFQAQ